MIADVYARLRDHFGPPHQWWPIFGDDAPFEMLLGAVLVQQTRWESVEGAILRLRDAGLLDPAALAEADPTTLAALLRPVAFHTQKAPGIIAISGYLLQHYNGDLPKMLDQPTVPLRRELLALPRIGPETADVILLYIGGHEIFVVDEYTRRLFERLTMNDGSGAPEQAVFDWRRARYDVVQQHIEHEIQSTTDVPLAPLYNDYHALINEECVRYCLARPCCDGPPARRVYTRQAERESYLDRQDGCPLRPLCGFYRAAKA